MTHIVTTWLIIFGLLAGAAWLTAWSRRDTAGRLIGSLALPFAAALALVAVYVPLGDPLPRMPSDGDYSVLGMRIVPDEAIYALMARGGGEPVYYRLPYSKEAAEELQREQYEGAPGGELNIRIDGGEIMLPGEGGNATAQNPYKQPEVPTMRGAPHD